MNLDDLRDELIALANLMDGSIEDVHTTSAATQEKIYELLLRRMLELDYVNGRLNPNQPIAQRIAKITKEINDILDISYTPRITEYLATYSTVEDKNISLQQSYNELVINKSLLSPARKAVYDQAEYYLVDGLADAYVQPAKYLLLQSVTNGITLKQAKSLLKNWNEGNLSTGGLLTSNRPTPRLQTYATQVARDSLYQYNGTIQDIIGDKFKLTKGLYVGGLVKDSRPFCKHMVDLNRKIDINEIPALLERYPAGIIPGTTKKNFPVRRGGFSCQHLWMWVKG